ncbi:hypothetical protein [Streptococcus agalactiae]|uniref:Uncharacterized protein n=1 Tax=Streptococcus agalactiae MRI Z1-216 TaxID=1154879 RepID=A0AAD2WYI5_STRAG|nr:hypothetical protein [Streptococcus agalactiae]EPU40240.1 hypothetical protein SAG0162_11445 [Streptococcus agalactiae MRI Z1-214]EPU43498.1 hypothetical protein SAG0164_12415 [Streptococcus agalactiae MRI Z1-216]EPX04243.1 hypothetical protein SAG0165_00005 [Streptococcus agalactiae MRI Z1-217]RRA63193.1 hypothetical protein D5F95_00920 [Streptococcus agalactiae]RRA94596.1 hypothetical protein D5F93_11530 [Streptococcus agalactiae]
MKNFEDNLTTNPRTGVLADFFEKTASGEFGEPDNTYLGDISLFKNDPNCQIKLDILRNSEKPDMVFDNLKIS